MSRARVLSLFSGLGGLDLGLEAAGFVIAGSIEIDETVRKSVSRNRPTWSQLEPHDIAEFAALDSDQVRSTCGEIDVIAGAPPCQPFSTAGQWSASGRNGLSDHRGVLIFNVLSLVRALQPKIVVLENVQGFVGGTNSVLPTLANAVVELERSTGVQYQLEHRVVDAHHFGVAQSRRRAIVTLSRVGPLMWPDPLADGRRPTAWDAIGSMEVETEGLETKGKWADLLPSIPEGSNYQWHTNRGGGLPLFGYRTRYWSFLLKLAKAQPAWTLAAQPGPSTGPFHWDSRLLAIEEMLRLQSFPIDWRVDGSRREQVRQIGNATPPALAEALGRAFITALGRRPPEHPLLRLEHSCPTPPPTLTTAVPPTFLDLVDDHEDHPGTGLGPAPRTAPV